MCIIGNFPSGMSTALRITDFLSTLADERTAQHFEWLLSRRKEWHKLSITFLMI